MHECNVRLLGLRCCMCVCVCARACVSVPLRRRPPLAESVLQCFDSCLFIENIVIGGLKIVLSLSSKMILRLSLGFYVHTRNTHTHTHTQAHAHTRTHT